MMILSDRMLNWVISGLKSLVLCKIRRFLPKQSENWQHATSIMTSISLSQLLINESPEKIVLSSEIKQLTVRLENSDHLVESAAVIRSILNRHHFNNEDFSIVVPYELLKQEEKERRIYNLLLASIAAISLIVGGIGIMNIMLASVLERTNEIGIRRAIGGRRSDIMSQFVTEAVVLSISGGIIGVILGVSLSLGISLATDVQTSITLYSIFIAFGFSVLVGVTFGYLPAKKAANLKPIESIRHE